MTDISTVAETIAALQTGREIYERMNGRESKPRVVDTALAYLERLHAENERLREALRKIKDGDGVCWSHKPTVDMQDIAEEALRLVPALAQE